MAETYQTQSELLTLYADNTAGDISAQDLRDGVVSFQALPNVVPVSAAFGGGTGTRADRATAVNAAIAEAVADSKGYVLVPDDYLNYDASAVTFDNSVRMVREGQVTAGFDVLAYGGAGDGVTDDIAAFNAADGAAAASVYGVIVVPHNTYLLSTTWNVSQNNSVIGHGFPTLLFSDNTSDAVDIAADSDHIELRNFQVDYQTSGGSGNCLTLNDGCNELFADNINLTDGNHGLISHQLFLSTLSRVRSKNMGNAAFFIDGETEAGSGAATTVTLRSCFASSSLHGYFIENTSGVNFVGCAADQNTNRALFLNNCRGATANGCTFEDNVPSSGSGVIWLEGSDLTINGGRISGTTGGTDRGLIRVKHNGGSCKVVAHNLVTATTDTTRRIYASGATGTFECVLIECDFDQLTDRIDSSPASLTSIVEHRDGARRTTVAAFSDGDATPDVSRGETFQTANTSPTTITGFDGGITGQRITVLIADGNTTIDFTATNLLGNGGADWSPASGDHMTCVYDGTDWHCDISDNTA